MNNLAIELVDEIKGFNEKVNAETPFTARIRILRPATKALDASIMDKSDWSWENLDGQTIEADILEYTAICVVDIYFRNELHLTLPNLLIVYMSDLEYLGDAHREAVETFNTAFKQGIIK